jgi:hypothetical protein
MQQISHQPEFSIPLQKHVSQRTEPAHNGCRLKGSLQHFGEFL